jgi:hypothetical protein
MLSGLEDLNKVRAHYLARRAAQHRYAKYLEAIRHQPAQVYLKIVVCFFFLLQKANQKWYSCCAHMAARDWATPAAVAADGTNLSKADLKEIVVQAAIQRAAAQRDVDPFEEEAIRRLDKIALPKDLTLQSGLTLKTPALWPVQAIFLGVTRVDITNNFGNDGFFIISLRTAFGNLWENIASDSRNFVHL